MNRVMLHLLAFASLASTACSLRNADSWSSATTTEVQANDAIQSVTPQSGDVDRANGRSNVESDGEVVPSICATRGLPMVAVWLRDGNLSNGEMVDCSHTPIRAVVWEDGMVLCGADPRVWDFETRRCQLSLEDVSAIKDELLMANVFKLPATCYLVDDGAIICTLVNINGQSQILYWNEYEASLRTAKPQNAVAFQNAWVKVNSIVCDALHKTVQSVEEKEAQKVPRAWYIKPMIQSE